MSIYLYIYIYIYIVTARPLSPQEGARSRSPQLGELWGERERSLRQYSSQVSVFKPALFTEHSNADKKKRRIYSSRFRSQCWRERSLPLCKHGRGLPRGPRPTSVNTPSDTLCVFIMLLFTIRLIRAPSYLADAGKARLPVVCSPRRSS